MEPTRPASCWQCGTVLSTDGGRCPACGVDQPSEAPLASGSPTAHPGSSRAAAEPAQSGSLRPRSSLGPRPPIRSPEKVARDRAIPWVVLGVGLLAILFVGVMLAPHGPSSAESAAPRPPAPTTAAPSAEPADPNDLRIGDPGAVDPADVLVRAKTRAVAWNRDALLVSMRAHPVSGGKVNLTSGGTIEYVFGKPTGEGFGAGARVSGKRLRILLAASGTTIEEVPSAAGRAALEPNCPLDEAARKAQAAGLPASAPVSVVYEINDKHPKPVWRVTATGGSAETRTLDGWTCAILVR